MARRDLHGMRAIITGASGGIGQAIAIELARCGTRLMLTARREPQLEALCDELDPTGRSIRFVAGDITDANLRTRLLQECEREFGGLDILVNNAGIGAVGPFATANPARLQKILQVNFVAPVELIREALPALSRGRHPLIVNIGSVLGHRAVPNKSEYCASKFAMHGFSDALRAELAPQGIDVLLVSPSTTDSEFFDQLLEDESVATRARGMSPEMVARKCVAAMAAGRSEVILSWGGTLLVWVDRLCPPLANWLVKRFC
jgi:short-subunit dehydrogenase